MKRPHFAKCLMTAVGLAVLAGCSSSVVRVQHSCTLNTRSRWVLLPFLNHSETPQANERVEAMLGPILRAKGIGSLDAYLHPKQDETTLVASDHQRFDAALGWAKSQNFDYALTGSVEEWRYKSGLDGDPAVGVTVRIFDIATGKVFWSVSGARTGSGSDSTSATALKLLDTLAQELDVGTH